MRTDRHLGDKVGPRLAQLVLTYSLAARKALAPHEAKVRQAATQHLIDRAGAEVADHFGPLLRAVLDGDDSDLHPLMREHLERAAAGTHQWHSLSSLLGMGMQNALGGALSNAVAPITYEINAAGPNLNADPQVWAAGVAAGWTSFHEGYDVAIKNGLGGGNFQLMTDLAQSVPDAGTLAQLVNRDLLSEAEAQEWLLHAAVPERLRAIVMSLRRQLLSPADAALGQLRGTIPADIARTYARMNGMTDGDFAYLVDNTGEPLGLMQLLEAFRRGIISQAELERGIRQSRVRDEWIPAAIALRYEPMGTADAADAALRGHLTEAEAQKIAELNGLRPQDWAAYYANQGNPPAPEQLLELWRRGYISQDQVQTGLRQGRTRDQWIPAVLDLRDEPMSVADAVDAWQRGHLSEEAARQRMNENGLMARDQPVILANAGNPLALEQLLEAFRRGFIDESRLKEGIREGRLRDDWADTAIQLRYSPGSTADAIGATVQGYLDRDQARAVAERNGLDPADFGWLLESAGEPLSRTELEQLYNRGKVSADDVRQGLRESRLKDKYVDQALELHVRLPEQGEVTRALTEGVITRAQAVAMLGDLGYSAQTVAMLVAMAETRTTGPHRQLAMAQVSRFYADRIIGRDTAMGLLEQLHYTASAAALILQLADYDLQQRVIESGLVMLRTNYLAGRITDAQAAADIHALGLPPEASAAYLKVWRIDRLAHPKQLTAAQVVKANKLLLFVPEAERADHDAAAKSREAAQARLVGLGYSPGDAGLLLDGA
jgi:hypothetical protein